MSRPLNAQHLSLDRLAVLKALFPSVHECWAVCGFDMALMTFQRALSGALVSEEIETRWNDAFEQMTRWFGASEDSPRVQALYTYKPLSSEEFIQAYRKAHSNPEMLQSLHDRMQLQFDIQDVLDAKRQEYLANNPHGFSSYHSSRP